MSNTTQIINCTDILKSIIVEERICYLYIALPISIIGFLLNLIAIKVFSNKSFNTIAFSYLRFMTHIDLIICCLLAIYSSTYYTYSYNAYDEYARLIYLVYLYIPLANIASNLTMLITILVTLERLISIKWPNLKHKLFHIDRFKTSCTVVILIAIVFNLIYFFLYEIIPYAECKTYIPLANEKITTSRVWFIYGYLKEFLMRIVPIVFLVIANALLINTVRESRARMSKTKFVPKTNAELKRNRQDSQLTLMTIFVAVMYSICSIPMLAAYPGLVFKGNQLVQPMYKTFAGFVNILALSQSAFRFVIYYCFTTQFRLIFKRIFNDFFHLKSSSSASNRNRNGSASRTTRFENSFFESRNESVIFINKQINNNLSTINTNREAETAAAPAVTLVEKDEEESKQLILLLDNFYEN